MVQKYCTYAHIFMADLENYKRKGGKCQEFQNLGERYRKFWLIIFTIFL